MSRITVAFLEKFQRFSDFGKQVQTLQKSICRLRNSLLYRVGEYSRGIRQAEKCTDAFTCTRHLPGSELSFISVLKAHLISISAVDFGRSLQKVYDLVPELFGTAGSIRCS